MKYLNFKSLVLFFIIFSISCASGPGTREYVEARSKINEYTVQKNNFFGYELKSKHEASEYENSFTHDTLGNVEVYPDYPHEGPFDKAYINILKNTKEIVKLQFTKELNSKYETTSFYGEAIRSLRENYPENSLNKINDEMYSIECTSSEERWLEHYAWYVYGAEYPLLCFHPKMKEIILTKSAKTVSLIYVTFDFWLELEMIGAKSRRGLEGI